MSSKISLDNRNYVLLPLPLYLKSKLQSNQTFFELWKTQLVFFPISIFFFCDLHIRGISEKMQLLWSDWWEAEKVSFQLCWTGLWSQYVQWLNDPLDFCKHSQIVWDSSRSSTRKGNTRFWQVPLLLANCFIQKLQRTARPVLYKFTAQTTTHFYNKAAIPET